MNIFKKVFGPCITFIIGIYFDAYILHIFPKKEIVIIALKSKIQYFERYNINIAQ